MVNTSLGTSPRTSHPHHRKHLLLEQCKMADVVQNGTSNMSNGTSNGTSNHHTPVVDDTILLKFQRYRDRLRVLGAEGKVDELVAHYDMYAKSFGQFFEITGYVGGMSMGEAIVKVECNKDAQILDCGCGDGALGSCLQKMGYTNLSALDPSQAMIDECSKKNIYRKLICDCVREGHTTKLDDDSYDVVAACAAFCPGHMNQRCFHELTRMIKPDFGLI